MDFGVGVGAWRHSLGGARDVVRQELVHRHLLAQLPEPAKGAPPTRVLDVGCGQGSQLLRLARIGYQVTGIEPSTELLGDARRDVAAERLEIQDRFDLLQGDIDHLDEVEGSFEMVCCHPVVKPGDSARG